MSIDSQTDASTVATPSKPIDPIMGKYFETIEGSGIWNARLGGKPKSDWSGLDPTANIAGTVGSAFRYRPLNPSSDQKGQAYRSKGLSTKFKQGSSVLDLQKLVWDHLEKHGLDTIAYLQDPQDPDKVLSAVNDHPKYRADASKFKTLAQSYQAKFDMFDAANDQVAREFLMESISDELKEDMKFKIDVGDPFTVVWLKLMKQVISSSTDRFEAIKVRIKQRTPVSYSGQNIEKMSQDFQTDAAELISAGHYDHTLTKAMITGYLKSTVKDSFSHALYGLETQVEKALQHTTFMSNDESDKYFAQEGLTMKDINNEVSAIYRKLKDANQWAPSKNLDSKTVPRAFAAIVSDFNNCGAISQDDAQQLLVLLQNADVPSTVAKQAGKMLTCYGCGAVGHTKRTCPNCRQQFQQAQGSRGGQGQGNGRGARSGRGGRGSGRGDRSNDASSWKTKAPVSGEAETKSVKGRTFNWCGKCKRWSTTHSTATHVSREGQGQGGRRGAPAANALVHDTTAWGWMAMAPVAPAPLHRAVVVAIMKYSLLAYGIAAFGALLWSLLIPLGVLDIAVQMATSIGSHVQSNWSSLYAPMLAPLSWFYAGLVASRGYPVPPVTSKELIQSKMSRAHRRHAAKPPKHRLKMKSAFDHTLHRSYPHRLRRDNIFRTRRDTPSVAQRLANHQVDKWFNQADRISRARYDRVDLLPSQPVTIRRDPFAPPITQKRTRELQRLIYGNEVPNNCPRFQRITVKKDNYMSPGASKAAPAYTKAMAHEVLQVMFGRERHSGPRHRCANRCHSRRRRTYHVHSSRTVKGSFGNKPPARHMKHARSAASNCVSVCARHQEANSKKTMATQLRKAAHHVYMASVSVSKALQIALHSPSAFRASLQPNASYPIIWDSGASVSITNCKDDFVEFNSDASLPSLKSLGGSHKVEGEGTIQWQFQDGNGMLRAIRMKAFYIPESPIRLLSTASLLQEYSDETIHLDGVSLHLSGVDGDPLRASVTVPLDRRTNLPTSYAYAHDPEENAMRLNTLISVTSEENFNLSEPEKELMRWHCRLGHLSYRKVQHIMRSGVLSNSDTTRRLHTAASKIARPPRCAACQFGKQRARPAPGRQTRVIRDKSGTISQGHLLPGSEISVDHFKCSTRGRLQTSFGKSKSEDMYSGGCMFVDHASGYLHVVNQTSESSHQTLRAKEEFELMCRDYGVVPVKYLSDNGSAFTSAEFREALRVFNQTIRHAGVGAHHHNGIAERSIGTVMSIARTMMLHSAVHWPEVADSSLWPFAVLHAAYVWNHCPNPATGISPSDIFTQSRWPHRRFHDLHVWGCPLYVLDKTIADGKKIPKWKPRSSRGMYLGRSPKHASSVPLVLNLDTGAIGAQFHVVFDDWFATVHSTLESLPDFSTDAWFRMFGESAYQYVPHELDETPASDPSDATDSATHSRVKDLVVAGFESSATTATRPLPVPPPVPPEHMLAPIGASTRADPAVEPRRDPVVEPTLPSFPSPSSSPPVAPSALPRRDDDDVNPAKPAIEARAPVATRTRPTRNRPVDRLTYEELGTNRSTLSKPRRHRSSIKRLTYEQLGTSKSANALMSTGGGPLSYDQSKLLFNLVLDSEPTVTPVIDVTSAFKAKVNLDPDILTFDQAMDDTEHREEWKTAALSEIRQLESKGTWTEVPLSEATSRVLPGTWVFRKKRRPDGAIKKFKSRYCCRGDLEEGVFDTYAPVVAFSTVRLFLIAALKMGWKTQSIDFSNAFVQAYLDKPVWIHLPRGFHSSLPGKSCLRLIKSLYGLSVAPRLWYQLVLKALKEMGFKASSIDPCLFFKANIFLILYVDDVGIAFSDEKYLEELIEGFKSRGLELTREGTFAEFLGIQYTDNKNGTVSLSQEGLIKKILAAADMSNCNPQWTPANKEALGIDPDGQPMQESWNYRSIVGMLLYLSTNTRPDISFAVSQVARFSHSPKQSHAMAVKKILRYLKATANRGTDVNINDEEFKLDCYVDADFAGLYGRDPAESSTSVKSRTGYIIKLAGCPLLWKSQLQTSIALSTGESEYSALSSAMRALLPIREQLLELLRALSISKKLGLVNSTIRSIAHEDNSSALMLATSQRITSRTRHYAVKWHFFWSHVKNGNVEVVKVPTVDQCADYLTKGLVREVFERCRRLSQGW